MQPDESHFSVMEGLPPYGPPARAFPTSGAGSHREGFVVKFHPPGANSWIGNFQPGGSIYSTVAPHPDGHRLVVISSGQGYIINPRTCACDEEIGSCYESLMAIHDLLILSTGCELEAIGPSGRRWITRRFSWDGIQNLCLTANGASVHGEAWSPMEDRWMPFKVDLKSGATTGGSYG